MKTCWLTPNHKFCSEDSTPGMAQEIEIVFDGKVGEEIDKLVDEQLDSPTRWFFPLDMT